MKYFLSPKMMEIAHTASKIPGVKFLLKPVYYSYKRWLNKKRNSVYRKYALELLTAFANAMNEINKKYTLAFGTLLGAVRERGFIKHDFDVDIAMWRADYSEEIAECLQRYGFKLIHKFSVCDEEKGLEETYEYKGITMDIFYFFEPINEYPYTCLCSPLQGTCSWEESMAKYGYLSVGRLELPFSKNVVSVDFCGIQVSIIENYKDFLSRRYGPDYMIPNASWHPSDQDICFISWPEVKGKYFSFD